MIQSFVSNAYYRIRQGIDWRFRGLFQKIRSIKHRISGVSINQGCMFESNVTFIYGWRTRFGKKCLVDAYTQFKCPISIDSNITYNIDIGDNVFIGRGTVIDSNFSVTIGRNTFIAPFCFITDTNHRFSDVNLPIRLQGCDYKKVEIEEDVWIGAHTVILAGVTIGHGSIIGSIAQLPLMFRLE